MNIELTEEEQNLYIALANITKTFYLCSEFGKAVCNKTLQVDLRIKMAEMGLQDIPDIELLKFGILNGKGSIK